MERSAIRSEPPPVGWDRGADRASNDADVSSIPPIIPYGGFSPVRLEGWHFGRRLPNASLSLSLLPACAGPVLVCFRPSCIAFVSTTIPLSVGSVTRQCTAVEGG